MDLVQLAQSVTGFLAPFLPYLLEAGEKATEGAAKKFGEDAYVQVRNII